MNDNGRSEIVFGKRCDEEWLEHEVLITEAEVLLNAAFVRSVKVGETIADALLTRDGNRFYIEVDNETMTTKQMREKWLKYGQNVDGFILVICRTKERLRQLLRGAELVKSVALFTRFRWLASRTVREPWVDWYGKRVKI